MIFRINAKKRVIIALLLVVYLISCPSCVLMRTSTKKTKVFFENAKITYKDTYFTEGENKLHYIQTGIENSATLIFVHGSPGSWDAYKNYLKDSLLLKKFRMIAIDRPGFGYSNFRKAENLETQSKQIASFIKSIDNKKPIILVGHSMGGPVITKLAVDNPSLFSHLVILSGAIDPKAETPEKWRPIIKAFPLRYLIPGALRPSNDELWWLKKDLVTMKPSLKNIVSDITVIHGTKDPLVPFSNVDFIKNEFVNAKSMTIIPIENANHFIPWEHYELIRNSLLNLSIPSE
ncbi:MAG: alpha/beta hydrolase [Flavobacterium sp.]|nr:alpha/beta hydrolase [Flavobacterium sp.]